MGYSVQLIVTTLLFLALDCRATRPQVHTNSKIIENDEKMDGIAFPSGSRFEMTENGHIYYAWAGKDFEVNGIKVLKGTQMMPFGNGKIQALWAQPGQRIFEFEVPSKTWVTFRPDGSVEDVVLESPQILRDLKLCFHTEFYPNGSFKRVSLSEDQNVEGLMLKKGEVTFHSNGKWMSAILAAGVKLKATDSKGHTKEHFFESGTRIYRDEAGLVVGAFPTKAGPLLYSKELHPL